MVDRRQVQCIIRRGGLAPNSGISGIGGVLPNGMRWTMSEEDAIKQMDAGTLQLYVSDGVKSAEVTVQGQPLYLRYLKTVPDGYPLDNLSYLPNCPQ